MQGARQMPQFNLRWPKEVLDLVCKVAEENGRSVRRTITCIKACFFSDGTGL